MRLHARFCLLAPDLLAEDVLIEIAEGRFVRVVPDATRAGCDLAGAIPIEGLVTPGYTNTHSHAFHRLLRGRAALQGDFWTWREGMYRVASALDPESYYALARLVYAEMALAGFTTVAEFHYLHHAPGGATYQDPNAMGRALLEAAHDAGVRVVLIQACYLRGGLGPDGYLAPEGTQLRFADRDVESFLARVDRLRVESTARIGYAIHSVRAARPHEMALVAQAARGLPLHAHVSEQPLENEMAVSVLGRSPTSLLAEAGALGALTTAVHVNHPLPGDLELLGGARATVSRCPSTEEDLGDGLAPTEEMVRAGTPLAIGSDQQVAIDPFREARSLELHERLRTGRRGVLGTEALWRALVAHASLGVRDVGRIAEGWRADLVELDLAAVAIAGSDPFEAVMAAGPTAVRRVLVEGREVARDGVHTAIGDVGRELAALVTQLVRKERRSS